MSIAPFNNPSLQRILILDSDKSNVKLLSALLSGYFRRTELIFSAGSFEEASQIIDQNNPSLIFADVNLGTEFKKLIVNAQKCELTDVVFTIDANNPAVEALKFSGVKCLLKPFEIEDLVTVMELLLVKQKLKTSEIPHQSHSFERITLRSQEGITCLDTRNIRRLESDSNYTHFFLKSGEKITISKTLKEYEDLLPTSQFFRTHQSHIVNLSLVKKFLKEDGGYALMDDGTQVLVSRRKKNGFLHALTA